MTVVNLPKFFDLVHPDNEIIVIKEIIPIKKEIPPISLGNIKSSPETLNGNPSVVIIRILVIENNAIKKKLAAVTANFIIFLTKRLLVSETKKLATTAIEKPANNELIIIIWSASLFQYSNDISISIILIHFINNVVFHLLPAGNVKCMICLGKLQQNFRTETNPF